MIACFDTSVHIELLRGNLSIDAVLAEVAGGPVRLSPVVASELLRGAHGRARRAVERLVDQLVSVEPPSWKQAWLEAGRLLPRLFPTHEEVGLGRLQNDVLIALTARHCGLALVTQDAHFTAIRRHVPFALVTIRRR